MTDKLTWAWVVFFLLLALWAFAAPYDDTDNKLEKVRSGMKLYTDHGTGCQYLSTGWLVSALTPRLDRNGKQVGCKR